MRNDLLNRNCQCYFSFVCVCVCVLFFQSWATTFKNQQNYKKLAGTERSQYNLASMRSHLLKQLFQRKTSKCQVCFVRLECKMAKCENKNERKCQPWKIESTYV